MLSGASMIPCDSIQTIRVTVPEASGKIKLNISDLSVSAIPYIADAAMGELEGILRYIIGQSITDGKEIHEPGQNTKSNVAISLLSLRKEMRGVCSVRFSLEPVGTDGDVSELCMYTRRMFSKKEKCIPTGILFNDRTKTVFTKDGTGVFGIGYDFNYDFNTFTAADDPWQRNFGFCTLYDGAAFLIGDRYETIRVPFRYDGRDWMVQLWKGVYSWNMLGGEIGLYNKPIERRVGFYDCASDPDRIEMGFTISLNGDPVVKAEKAPSWWQTAFTVHPLAKPKKLTMDFTMTFPTAQMRDAFAQSLASTAPQVTIRQNGLTLSCCWPASV